MVEAPPAVMLNALLVADVISAAAAASVYAPAWSMLMFANVASPVSSVITLAAPRSVRKRVVTGLAWMATATPAIATRLPKLSCSCTVTAGVIGCPAVVLVGCCRNASWLAVPATFVRLNVAGCVAPGVVAVTWNVPGVPFAVAVGAAAIPIALVVTVVGPANVTLAPLAGALNVTDAFDTGFPKASATLARSGAAYAVPTAAVCPLPSNTVMLAAAAGAIWNESLTAESAPAVARKVYVPVARITRSLNMAAPVTSVVPVSVPSSVAAAALRAQGHGGAAHRVVGAVGQPHGDGADRRSRGRARRLLHERQVGRRRRDILQHECRRPAHTGRRGRHHVPARDAVGRRGHARMPGGIADGRQDRQRRRSA